MGERIHPASLTMPGGATLYPLAGEELVGRRLLTMLDPTQLSQACISPAAPGELVQSNRPTMVEGALPLGLEQIWSPQALADPGFRLDSRRANREQNRNRLGLTPEFDERLRYTWAPKGLIASAMSGSQREALESLVDVYVACVAEPIAQEYRSRIDWNGTGFAWAGSLEPGEPHYYRVQSEQMLIEYDAS